MLITIYSLNIIVNYCLKDYLNKKQNYIKLEKETFNRKTIIFKCFFRIFDNHNSKIMDGF